MEKVKVVDITPIETKIQVRTDSLISEDSLRREEEVRKLINDYLKRNLKEGIDFYTIRFGGKESKPSLSKAGAEKFISLLHLRAEFGKDEDTWECSEAPQEFFVMSVSSIRNQVCLWARDEDQEMLRRMETLIKQ